MLCRIDPVLELNTLRIVEWNNNRMRRCLMSIVVTNKKRHTKIGISRNSTREIMSVVFCVKQLREGVALIPHNGAHVSHVPLNGGHV